MCGAKQMLKTPENYSTLQPRSSICVVLNGLCGLMPHPIAANLDHVRPLRNEL
jgi:hypothetical protein